AISRGLGRRTCSMKSAKVPDQLAALCCWVKATRLFTKSPCRSVSSDRFDILPSALLYALLPSCIQIPYQVPGFGAHKCRGARKNKLLWPSRKSCPGSATALGTPVSSLHQASPITHDRRQGRRRSSEITIVLRDVLIPAYCAHSANFVQAVP